MCIRDSPMADGPPVINGPPPRSSTAAPYPMDNGPPRIGSARPMAGGFAPEIRAASVRPPSSGNAFNINPNIYPANDGYGRGRPPLGPESQSLPLRPHSSVNETGPGGRGMRPVLGGRGGLPSAGPGGYRQPGGPSAQRPEIDRAQTAQPVDVGYSTPPDARNRLQKPGQGMKKTSTLPDIGYVAPLEPRQHTRPSTVQPGQESRTNSMRVDRPSTATPGQGSRPSSRPGSAGRPGPQDPMPKPQRAPTQQQRPPPQAAPASAPAPASKPAAPAPKPAVSSPPGKGPKTFDEMGIGSAPQDKDCVSYLSVSITLHALTANRLSCKVTKPFEFNLHSGPFCRTFCIFFLYLGII